ncbi:MAG TPA: peptidoglycan DD-metalloendopeptidase family protein [Thermoanaerobaculia bacterium]|nr:peptidoglycan DD-metalloendopeptidase family protein [Thermoanaerobaculia bacterium]
MSKSHHTVILVPHAHAKLRKWRITNFQIGLTAGALLALTLGSVFTLWSFFHTPSNPAELARLRQENERLRRTNQTFESDLQSLQSQLSRYEDRTRDLAIVAGLADVGNAEAGIGGGEPIDDATPDLASMADRAGVLDGTLDAVEAKLDERVHWLSATPAIAPVKGILTSGFGYRADPMTHGRGVHQGIDIAAPTGQPVQATANGIVLRASVAGGLGKAIYIAHGYGLTTRYGHLSEIDVQPGQRVRRGDLIGRVGNTGRSTGPHLHYEVRVDGQPVDPVAYILDGTADPF